MAKKHDRRRSFGVLSLAALCGLSLAIAGGASEAAPGPSGGAKQPMGSKVDKAEYLVELRAPGSCKAGSACTAEIGLKAKGAFHINDKFPIKFKAAEGSDVSYAKALVKREDGKFAEKDGTLPVGFTIAKAGRAKIAGVFSFSVCTDANCLMEKVDLDVDVEAK